MASWIFIPVGLRLEARLLWEPDGTIHRTATISAMEQEGSSAHKLGTLDRTGNLVVAKRTSGRRISVAPERLRTFSASEAAFERAVAPIAARVGTAYARASAPIRQITARWAFQTISAPHLADTLDWFELLVADYPFGPRSRVYFQGMNNEFEDSPFVDEPADPAYRTRLSYRNAPSVEAAQAPWPDLRRELENILTAQIVNLLPPGLRRNRAALPR